MHKSVRYGMICLVPILLFFAFAGVKNTNGQEVQEPTGILRDQFTTADFAIGDFALHYAETGTQGMPVVVFIHGTPGSWRTFAGVMESAQLQARARLVAIDRTGWGLSALPGRATEPDFAAQAALIVPLLQKLRAESPGQPLVLAGHSYGGSIAPYIAYQYPDLVDGLLIAAGAIDPVLGKPRWYNHAANLWPISRLLEERLAKANDEIWGVHEALATLEPWWDEADIPIIFVQGDHDRLVSPGNLDFAERRLVGPRNKVVRLPGQGHLLQVYERPLLVALTLELLGSEEGVADLGERQP